MLLPVMSIGQKKLIAVLVIRSLKRAMISLRTCSRDDANGPPVIRSVAASQAAIRAPSTIRAPSSSPSPNNLGSVRYLPTKMLGG